MAKILALVIVCLCMRLCLTQNFGFNNQQGNRRFQSREYDYNQNYYPNYYPNYPQNYNGISNSRQAAYNRPTATFVRPFNNRNQYLQYYDQYGRSIVRPYDEYTTYNQPYWGHVQEGQSGREIQDNYNYGEYNAEYVKFPDGGNDNNPVQPTAAPNIYEYYGEGSGSVNFPGGGQSDQPLAPLTPATTAPEPATLPPLIPAGTESGPAFTPEPDRTILPPLAPTGTVAGPAFTPVPDRTTLPPLAPAGTEAGPAFTPVPDRTTLPPLAPAGTEAGPAFTPVPDRTTLPPLAPAGTEAGPAFTPVPDRTTLPPLAPAGTEAGPAFTPVPDRTTLPPLTPVPESEYKNSEPVFRPVETTTLPPLTPVPSLASKTDFNFQPTSVFNEPCEVDGAAGNCVPILQCELFANLLAKARSDPQVITLLRKAHCGFYGNDPKVCCPASPIPDQPPPAPTPAPTPAPVPSEPPATEPQGEQPDGDFVDAFPEPPVCGNSTASFTRVVGGVDAKLGDFPWMALLGYKRRGTVSWNCGGTLISSRHVLTAAHCIHTLEQILYVVRLGELDLGDEHDGATPVDVLIKKATKHEDYDRSTISNDIGVLLLERSVQYTDFIRPICIPTSQELRSLTFEKYNPLIAGWGALEHKGPSAEKLQVLQLPVVSNTQCAHQFREYKQLSIDARVLCAGYLNGAKKDACQGDSGGPLMQPIVRASGESNTIHFYQIGVVSFGKKCAEPGYPGVYTRVTTFVPWIEDQVLGPNAGHV